MAPHDNGGGPAPSSSGYAEERFILAALRGEPLPPAQGLSARRILSLCDWHGVGPLVARAVESQKTPLEAGEELASGLGEWVHRTRVDNLLLLDRLTRLADLLEKTGIPYALLKGAAVLPLVYRGPEERPMADVDILIGRDDWPRLRQHLAGSGRYRLPSPERERVRVDYYQKTEIHTDEKLSCCFEIHWNLDITGRTVFDIPALLGRTVPVQLEGREYPRLADRDLVLHMAVHPAFHAFAPRLVWMHDLAQLARAGHVDWQQLAADARQLRAEILVHYSLSYLEKTYPGTVPPASLASGRLGRLRRRFLDLARTDNPILPTQDMMPAHRRWLYSLALLDTPGRMLRFTAWRAYRKLLLGLPSH